MEPDKFFIIPYRNREYQLEVFINHMTKLLEGENYQLLFIHQKDNRHFNRGAMKNIGFLYIKDKYPDTYQDKTLIFHDVDCVIVKKEDADFNTKRNFAKHNFGYKACKRIKALGGIVTMTSYDFERTKGFLNLWTWGLEDNSLMKRCLGLKINIDYNSFHPINCREVVSFRHDNKREMNNDYTFNNFWKGVNKDNGFKTIKNLNYTFEKIRDKAYFVNVNSFDPVGEYPIIVKNDKPVLKFEDPQVKKYDFLKSMF
jgi:hypothetical protein